LVLKQYYRLANRSIEEAIRSFLEAQVKERHLLESSDARQISQALFDKTDFFAAIPLTSISSSLCAVNFDGHVKKLNLARDTVAKKINSFKTK